MKKRILKSLVIPLLIIMLGVTACGGSSKSQAAVETTAAAVSDEVYAESSAKPSAGTGAQDKSSAEGGLTGNAGDIVPAPAGRKLIRNVNMSVETDGFDKLLDTVNAKITELGGYPEESNVTGTSLNYKNEPIPRVASITARIPSDKLSSFVSEVAAHGNVTNKSESTTDVTLQYSDTESRKKSLEIEQERIWGFLEKAESIDTVITLEQRLSDIRYQLESMESQLRLYDNQVDYSTVMLTIQEVTTFTATAPESVGKRIQNEFTKNLQAITGCLTSIFIGLVSTSPIWVPAAVILIIILLVIRRRNAKRPPLSEEKKETDK